MFATHSRTQATCSSIQPVFSGLDTIALPRYILLISFFWNSVACLDIAASSVSYMRLDYV